MAYDDYQRMKDLDWEARERWKAEERRKASRSQAPTTSSWNTTSRSARSRVQRKCSSCNGHGNRRSYLYGIFYWICHLGLLGAAPIIGNFFFALIFSVHCRDCGGTGKV